MSKARENILFVLPEAETKDIAINMEKVKAFASLLNDRRLTSDHQRIFKNSPYNLFFWPFLLVIFIHMGVFPYICTFPGALFKHEK
jgi:hypothetical protein